MSGNFSWNVSHLVSDDLHGRGVRRAPFFPPDSNAEEEEEEEGSFSSPLMFWLQQEQKRKESLAERKPKKGLVFEISSDDGFQICAESIEGGPRSLAPKGLGNTVECILLLNAGLSP